MAAHHRFIAAIGEHRTIDILGAANGGVGSGAGGGGAVHQAFEINAHFVFVAGLLYGGVEQNADQEHRADHHNQPHLNSSVCHLAFGLNRF